MTIFLILGAVAGLYVLALLFRLASYALPVYAGLTCAFLLLRHDVGHLGAILGGLSAGIATLLIGQGLIAFVRSPMLRVGIAFLFAIPAGIAGFQAAHALGSLPARALAPGARSAPRSAHQRHHVAGRFC